MGLSTRRPSAARCRPTNFRTQKTHVGARLNQPATSSRPPPAPKLISSCKHCACGVLAPNMAFLASQFASYRPERVFMTPRLTLSIFLSLCAATVLGDTPFAVSTKEPYGVRSGKNLATTPPTALRPSLSAVLLFQKREPASLGMVQTAAKPLMGEALGFPLLLWWGVCCGSV